MNKRRILNSSYLTFNKWYKINSSHLPKFNFDSLNLSTTHKKIKTHRHPDKLSRPSSTSSLFSQKINFQKSKTQSEHKVYNNLNNNLNILDLMLENNPGKYNYKKIRNKMKSIDDIYRNKNPKLSNVKEVYYKYNVLYGLNSSNLIRTYSPKMRPKSSSVNKFIKKINNERNKNVQVFEENEILELNIQKCADIGIDVKDHMILKFKEYCNSKCKNRCVDLTENFLGLNSIKFLGNILYNSDRISKLNLSKNNLGDAGIEILINAIKDSKSLITLNIASNGITYIGGEIIFKNLINQQSIIDFNVCTVDGFNRNRNRLTYSGIKDIIPFLKHNLFIEYFNLSGNSIKNEGFIAVCKGLNENKSLVTLKLSHNEIEEKGIIQGLKFINTQMNKLTYLDLSKNKIQDEGIIALTYQLNYFQNLTSLNISFCGFEFRSFDILLKNLQYNRKIEILNVSGNKIKDKNFDKIKPYFSYLGIKSLNLSKCSLCDNSAFILGECLENNLSIKKLNISDNEITDKGFQTFDKLFFKNSIITHFDCSSNYLTNNGIKNLIKSLEVNNSLKSLNLYDNQLQKDIGNLIVESLRKNKSLVFINLYYNRIPIKKIDEINKFIKINADNQKLKFIPNLIRSVRQLEFNPNQFEILSLKIKNKKIETDSLYKKVKEEDNIYSSEMEAQQKNIDIKESKLESINKKIRSLEKKIHNIEKEIFQEEKVFKEQENKLNRKIIMESDNLNEALKFKSFAEKDYKEMELESDNLISMTQEKYNISDRACRKVQLSLNDINDYYNNKSNELQKLMSIKFSRNTKKKHTTLRKNSNISKSRSGTMISNGYKNMKGYSPSSMNIKNEENKESTLFNIQENDEIKEENKDIRNNKRHRNKSKAKISIIEKNKNNKNLDKDTNINNFYKTKNGNPLLYFPQNNG